MVYEIIHPHNWLVCHPQQIPSTTTWALFCIAIQDTPLHLQSWEKPIRKKWFWKKIHPRVPIRVHVCMIYHLPTFCFKNFGYFLDKNIFFFLGGSVFNFTCIQSYRVIPLQVWCWGSSHLKPQELAPNVLQGLSHQPKSSCMACCQANHSKIRIVYIPTWAI